MTAPPDEIAHGGRIAEARRRFAQAPQPWIDLSTGVNPHAYPVPALAPHVFTHLPDEDAFAACASAARIAYRAAPSSEIVIGAGVQNFIQALPRIFPAKHVAILGFTYAEHGACWARAGARVETVETLEALTRADIAVLVNPNNPDGRLTPPQQIADLAAALSRKGAMLVVDESFMDFTSASSIAPLALDDVIVLRSFGKTYGLPGLRLGFALCASRHALLLRAALGPWAASGPALAIGARALADLDWRARAQARCAEDAARLDALLLKAGFEVIGGTTLYRLVSHVEAPRLFARLAGRGILVREFPEQRAWLRFGLPREADEWMRLSQALEASDD